MLVPVVVTTAQQDPGYSVLERAAAALQRAEPEWQFVTGIMNVPKLFEEELGVAGGTWRRSDGNGAERQVSVRLHRGSSEQAIARWMSDDLRRVRKDDWKLSPYDLGDRATLAIMNDAYRAVTWYQLSFQRGRFLASVNGQSRADVERLARYVLAEMKEQ
jgi:hypothetical protein